MVKAKTKLNSNEKKLVNLIGRVIDEKTKTVLATKDDLKRFATKDDLKNAVKDLLTKEEAKKFLTKADYYNSADRIMKELEIIREESLISTDMKRMVNEHEDRLETIEEKLNISLPI